MNPITALSKVGIRGGAKSFYHSHRNTNSAASLIFHSKVITDISPEATFNINNRMTIGVLNLGASHPRRARSVFTVCPSASISHTGTDLARFGPASVIHVEGELSMGDSYFNSHARIMCGDEITIGDGCAIAWGAELLDDDRHSLEGSPKTAPIRIEDDVWIGHDVSVGKGVTIGEGSVIASDSVVRSDIPPESLVAGCPAEVIKEDIDWSP